MDSTLTLQQSPQLYLICSRAFAKIYGRDSRALDELLCYEQKQNGSFGAIVGKHDDILMTRAIGLWVALREMELPRIVKNEAKKVVATRKVVSAATL